MDHCEPTRRPGPMNSYNGRKAWPLRPPPRRGPSHPPANTRDRNGDGVCNEVEMLVKALILSATAQTTAPRLVSPSDHGSGLARLTRRLLGRDGRGARLAAQVVKVPHMRSDRLNDVGLGERQHTGPIHGRSSAGRAGGLCVRAATRTLALYLIPYSAQVRRMMGAILG